MAAESKQETEIPFYGLNTNNRVEKALMKYLQIYDNHIPQHKVGCTVLVPDEKNKSQLIAAIILEYDDKNSAYLCVDLIASTTSSGNRN